MISFILEIVGIILGVGMCYLVAQGIGNPRIYFIALITYGIIYSMFLEDNEDNNGKKKEK